MKEGLIFIVFIFASMVGFAGFSLPENPQDPEKGKKRHIKMVKIENGEKIELDTIIEGEDVLVWKGDTIGAGLKWISSEDKLLNLDSLKEHGLFDFDIDISEDGEKKIFMYKKEGGESNKMIFIGEDDALHKLQGSGHAVFVTEDGNRTMVNSPKAVKIIKEKKGGNIIDLSDPGIISYKKKKLSGGREKIEIIRNEVAEDDDEVEVIIGKAGGHNLSNTGQVEITKSIKKIKQEDGAFNIFEYDGEKLDFSEKDGNLIKVKEIKNDDGSVIHIEEIEEGNMKKIKVVVKEIEEENTESENKE